MIPIPLQNLIKNISKLPGLGPRSAQRLALELITTPEKMQSLQRAMAEVSESIQNCTTCGNIALADPCHICTDQRRDQTKICIVEGVDDLWALERSNAFTGLYHILGGVVNALDGIGPEDLNLTPLLERVKNQEISEIILALSAGIEGQTTSHLVAKRLKDINPNLNITTLAKGVPMGADVDYLDDGTLALALQGRRTF